MFNEKKDRWATTLELMEIQGNLDHMLQRYGLSDWQAMQACLNHCATLICQNYATEDKRDKRLEALQAAIENLSKTVKEARFAAPDHEIGDWEKIDATKASKFKLYSSPDIEQKEVDYITGPVLAYGLKLTKDCLISSKAKACATYQPMDERGNNRWLVLGWVRDRPPWDLIVVKDQKEAENVCKRLSQDGLKASELFQQKKNTRKAV